MLLFRGLFNGDKPIIDRIIKVQNETHSFQHTFQRLMGVSTAESIFYSLTLHMYFYPIPSLQGGDDIRKSGVFKIECAFLPGQDLRIIKFSFIKNRIFPYVDSLPRQ